MAAVIERFLNFTSCIEVGLTLVPLGYLNVTVLGRARLRHLMLLLLLTLLLLEALMGEVKARIGCVHLLKHNLTVVPGRLLRVGLIELRERLGLLAARGHYAPDGATREVERACGGVLSRLHAAKGLLASGVAVAVLAVRLHDLLVLGLLRVAVARRDKGLVGLAGRHVVILKALEGKAALGGEVLLGAVCRGDAGVGAHLGGVHVRDSPHVTYRAVVSRQKFAAGTYLGS